MQPKARMTIRFEPPGRTQPMKPLNHPQLIAKPSLTEEFLKPEKFDIEQAQMERNDVEPAQVEQDNWDSTEIKHGYTVWNNPPQDDIHALEEMIRTSSYSIEPVEHRPSLLPAHPIDIMSDKPLNERDPAYPVSQVDENLLSAQNHNRARLNRIHAEAEAPPSGWSSQLTNTSEGPSWTRVFLSVTSAVATGALFGYLVLGLFTGEPLFPAKSDNRAQNPAAASLGGLDIPTTVSTDVTRGSEPTKQLGGEADLMTVPAEIYYMLQYGVFQSEESMQIAVKQVQELGLEPTVERNMGYRVYVGAALTRDTAELLAAELANMELYIKPVESASLSLPSASLPEGARAFMNTTAEYIRKLAQYSSYYLQDQLPEPMNEVDSTALAEAQQQWLSQTPIAAMLGKDSLEEGENIIQALNSAALSMREYNSKPSRFHLWSVQSNTTKAMLSFRNLREGLLSARMEK
jgi:hypothetical protein